MKPSSIPGQHVGKSNLHDPIKIAAPEWLNLAACAGMENPNEAFPRYHEDARRFIRHYCWDCPVVRECGQLGIDIKAEYGVFGGRLLGSDQDGPAPEPGVR